MAPIAGGLWDDRIAGVLAVNSPASYLTDAPYGPSMRMGVLLPGVVGVGDVPQLVALMAPRRLVIADGLTPSGERLKEKELTAAMSFATDVYRVHKAADKLTVAAGQSAEQLVAAL